MRRILAILAGSFLVVAFAAPVASAGDGSYITDLKILSATIDKTGQLHFTGTFYCQNMDYWNIEAQGQVIQAIGKKTTIRGGVWGGTQCEPNGPTTFEAWSFPDWGMYGPGWVTLQIGFGSGGCDGPDNCWWNDVGGGQFYVKVVKK